MQTFLITSVTRHQQCFSTRNTKVNGRNNATPIMQSMIEAAWRLLERSPETRVAMRRELIVNACVLNIPRYIFIVHGLSILSKLDSNNPYCIWAELYFSNLNYLIILDTWLIWPSRGPRRSRFISWSYLSFGPILFAAHLLVWPSYGDNRCPLVLAIIILKPPSLVSVASPLRSPSLNMCATFIYVGRDFLISDSLETVTVLIHIPSSLHLTLHRCTVHPSPSSNR
jgi:hypothetical protein